MRIHTQNILQQALIKRKLEEQKENFRKRQENREKSPLLDGGVPDGDRRRPPNTTPASLAFTPTAVLRNMKAEARGSPEHRPKGRPLVKTNPDGPHMSVSAGNIQSVAAKLLETQAQLQQQQHQHQHQHHQQQQPWLRAAAPAGHPPPLASNPLARWFSPEVLASARAAQLPDLPASAQQRVLSVEELERHQVLN
ncbi:uncharacterized protein LOC119112045 [Pollicipes pollicipes]|uniref:uncharacterized protein LOC119112045 n=1 Tax=Pollicipes pollicipes TaxID=41117 RepID=UPI001884ACDE|nr:uncharacterized protein LOC119112045 [Pollicipes pollicipes]